MELAELVDRYDEKLRTDAYADIDASANGLQVGSGGREVEHVAVAVDAATATIDEATEAGADVLVTHHGLSWGGIERVTGRAYDRIARLVDAETALYVSHLPLDGHQQLGNAAGVAEFLGLTERAPFATLGGEPIGQRGQLSTPRSPRSLKEELDELPQGGEETRLLSFGPEEVEEVGIVTGSGADFLDDAVAAGVDTLVTGEGKQQVYHQARESGVNVLLAGHYATETFGVRALASLAADWGLETTYVEHPTGL
ncbi:Nif3-like dinuclear metal center hexameric protein [Salinigranum rubrum]|uniref:Nif3-like dinuclear metal center hexameric protein n=1 Tax=Salinigranum rubrum TaxID=755307 RepID=A0A2I8VME3_9EURY|nr:Nif3-like dinuclear metal center hexameric protein [Salinigranum rubrum]AUV83107.1 Nif3-like dinuclear metal center hexameric protein [Salinigranum rubrum]